MIEHNTFEQIAQQGDITEHQIDGELVSMKVQNVFGGDDSYDADQQLVLRTEQNVFGGKNYNSASEQLIGQTIPSHDGDLEVYSGGLRQYVGHSHETAVGRELDNAIGNTVSTDFDLGHGFHDVMHQSDPLMHAGDYVIPDLDLMYR